jgi:hypothetical protein
MLRSSPLCWVAVAVIGGCAAQPQLLRDSARGVLVKADLTDRPECVRAFAQAHQTRGSGRQAVAPERQRKWAKIDWEGCPSVDTFLDNYFDSTVAASVALTTPLTDSLRTELIEAGSAEYELEPGVGAHGRPVSQVVFAKLPLLQLGCLAEVPAVEKIVLKSGPCAPSNSVHRR